MWGTSTVQQSAPMVWLHRVMLMNCCTLHNRRLSMRLSALVTSCRAHNLFLVDQVRSMSRRVPTYLSPLATLSVR